MCWFLMDDGWGDSVLTMIRTETVDEEWGGRERVQRVGFGAGVGGQEKGELQSPREGGKRSLTDSGHFALHSGIVALALVRC